jgi:hypothetical protein
VCRLLRRGEGGIPRKRGNECNRLMRRQRGEQGSGNVGAAALTFINPSRCRTIRAWRTVWRLTP